MRFSGLLGLATLFAVVAGEVCRNCPKNDLLAVNFTTPGALDKILVAAGPDDSDSEGGDSAATDEVYDHCRQKGCALEWAMQHSNSEVGPLYVPPRTTAQSPFQAVEDLRTWYWNDDDNPSPYYDELDNEWWGIGTALKSLGLPWKTDSQGGPNRITSIVHSNPLDGASTIHHQTYQANGKTYRVSGGEYTLSVNLQDGVVIGINRAGPASAGQKLDPPLKPDEMPQLHQFSDVGWLKWKSMAQANNVGVNNLRYFISISIENQQTKSVCKRIFQEKGIELKKWPGDVFLAGTDDFHAILGTPNIQGYGYMLAQHKADLGNMFISKLHVFLCDSGELCIVAFVSPPVANPVTNPTDEAMDDAKVISGEISRRDEGSNIMRLHKIFAKL